MDESPPGSNKLLSQSYTKSLERVLHRKIELDLPKVAPEKIKEREETWDRLFKKYSTELSDVIEINLNSPSEDEELEEDDDDEEDDDEQEDDEDNDDDEEQNDLYFNKARTPMRKSSSLVQYWVDTGKHPYSYIDDHSRSVTGSSLSEEDCQVQKNLLMGNNVSSPAKAQKGNSNCSSVDTAAYILSNTNRTKKAEAMVIVEGSKRPENPLVTIQSPPAQKSPLIPQSPREVDKLCDNNNKFLSKVHDRAEIFSKLEERIRAASRSLSRTGVNSCNSDNFDNSDNSEIKATVPSIMKIADVLPTLEQYDKLINKPNDGLNDSERMESSGKRISQTLGQSKKGNRRKLYTGRDSPMDVIVALDMDGDDQVVPKSYKFHPAFQATPKAKVRVPNGERRINSRRHTRKLFRVSDSTKDSAEKPSNGKERTFLKSLGLVPTPKVKIRTKQKVINGLLQRQSPRKQRLMGGLRDSNSHKRESFKETLNGKVSQDLLALCHRRELKVRLEKLLPDVLRKFDSGYCSAHKTNNKLLRKTKQQVRKNARAYTLRARTKRSQSPKIDLDSQDSDQSTIIIINCNKNTEKALMPPRCSKELVIELEKYEAPKRSKDKDKRKMEEPLSAPVTRSKKSSSECDTRRDHVKNKKLVLSPNNAKSTYQIRSLRSNQLSPNPEATRGKRLRNRNPERTSPPQMRSRRSTSVVEITPEAVRARLNNKDSKQHVEPSEALDNRTIRRLRRQSALKKAQKTPLKRKSRRVIAKKVRVRKGKEKSKALHALKLPPKDQEGKDKSGGDIEVDTTHEIPERSVNEEASLRIGTIHVALDSNSETDVSEYKKPRRPLTVRRLTSKPIITFSSDDESDFITKMAKSAYKFERRSRKKSVDDQQNLNNAVPGKTAQVFLGTIMDSDEEERLEKSKEVRSRRSDVEQKKSSPKKPSSIVKIGRDLRTSRNSVKSPEKLGIVRVLSFDDTLSKQSEEVESPPKKFKAKTGVVNRHNSNRIEKSDVNEAQSKSHGSSESTRAFLGRSLRSNGIQSKADCRQVVQDPIVEKSPVKEIQSRKVPQPLSPIVTILRQRPVQKLASPVRSQAKQSKPAVKSPRRLSPTKEKVSHIEGKNIRGSIEKISKDLGKSFKNDRKSSHVVTTKSPNKPVKAVELKKVTRNLRKRLLPSDDESSVDFILQKSNDDHSKFGNESSDESTKGTLFHNPFEDSGDKLEVQLNASYKKRQKIKAPTVVKKKSVMTFRTRDDSDSDD